MTVRLYFSEARKKSAVAQVSSRWDKSGITKSSRVNDLLDLMDAVSVVPFLTASGAVVGRGVVGPAFDVVPSSLDVSGSERERKRILDFFNYISPTQENVKDIYGPLAKLYTTAFSFRLFGHSAWEVVRDKSTGEPIGFDVIPGVIRPNIEKNGSFKRPAYTQFLRANGVESKTDINDPDDVIFFAVPDYSGGLYLSELLALSEYTLPSEIYAAVAYRSLHENKNAPYSGIWFTPPDVDDDTFDRFVAMINSRYTGARNYGRNPIIMRGEGGFKPLNFPKEEAPYLEGRTINRNEISAASGVPDAKYGVGSENIDLKELRLEFYESTLRPMMALMEEVIYSGVCVRLFDAPEWKFKFKRPDFTTAVEDASIELRRIQWGQWSPNEARASRGELPRENGDYYLVPKNMDMIGPDGKPGRPADEPVDDDSGEMEPSEEDPVPDTMPPEKPDSESSLLDELRKWRKFELRVATGKRYKREFESDVIPAELYDFLRESIKDIGDDPGEVAMLFDDMIEIIGGEDGL
jgi:hypothetical protein